MQSPCSNDDGVYKYLRKLMALPFLPDHQITPIFHVLKAKTEDATMHQLLAYMKSQWIDTDIFPPACWSVYKEAVRTNNDLEGWHNSLNRHAGQQGSLCFYSLLELLHREALLTAINIRLVSEEKLKRLQRKKYKNLQERLFEQWGLYEQGLI